MSFVITVLLKTLFLVGYDDEHLQAGMRPIEINDSVQISKIRVSSWHSS